MTLPPDTVLDGRYALQSIVTRRGPVTLWRGDDAVLARSVAVRVVEHGIESNGAGPAAARSPRDEAWGVDRGRTAQRLLRAAVASGRLVHPGAASTYDATTTETPIGPVSYVVSEWVEGTSLERLLSQGPIRPERAVAIVLAIARVVAAAHVRGVHHGDLHPSDVVITPHGAVKLIDLEIGAAVAALDGGAGGVATDGDALVRRDVVGLGAILYATLTGRWPLGAGAGLPAAPTTPEGRMCAPRQARAGVPRELDTLTLATLGDSRSPRLLVTSAAELVAALNGLAAAGPALTAAGPALDDDTPPLFLPPEGPRGRLGPPPDAPRRRLRAMPWVVAALIGAIVAVAIFSLPRSGGSSRGGAAAAAALPLRVVTPTQVKDFDPQGGDGQEQPAKVPLATDGNPATAWHTETYTRDSHFGRLKQGVGLRIDFGRPVRLRQADLTFFAAGQSLELRAADVDSPTEASYARLTGADDAGTTAQLKVNDPRPHEFWVVWLTNLPAVPGGFQGSIAEMVFRS